MKNNSIFAILSIILCFAFILFTVRSKAVAANEQEDASTFVLDAMQEIPTTNPNGKKYNAFMGFRYNSDSGTQLSSYVAWLQYYLMHAAQTGELFVTNKNKDVFLVLTWQMGDDLAWYIGTFSVTNDSGECLTLQKHLLWRNWGSKVTPDGPSDNPEVEQYKLKNVEPGDIVRFDLYALPRDSAKHDIYVNPDDAVNTGNAELVMRLNLPVWVKPSE